MNAVARAGHLSPYFKATSTFVASGLKPAPAAVPGSKKVVGPPTKFLISPKTPRFLQAQLPAARLRVQSGIAVSTQVRYAHTDIEIPDFSAYRRKEVQDPTIPSRDSYEDRKSTAYMIAAGGTVLTMYSAKFIVTSLVQVLAPSKDVLALSSVEVNLADIPEGKSVIIKWRGKPIFLRHRAPSEIATERAVPLSSLRDPQHDDDRAVNPKYLVVIGICTHLGCVPIANAGEFGGYYCPCHGSHYDASGRIRKGPAPLNLEVPPHQYPSDNVLLIG